MCDQIFPTKIFWALIIYKIKDICFSKTIYTFYFKIAKFDHIYYRWMCHGFLSAGGDTGERLSHAVGCAFAICLEKKQMREKVEIRVYREKGLLI